MDYDLIVMGGGSAGYAAARTAADLGKKVAIIDGATELGGLCILKGCMPSKTLLYVADILQSAKTAKILGLNIPKASADMPAVARRKRKIIDGFAAYRRGSLESGRFDLFRQLAHFSGHNEIELLDGTKLTAKKFVIATGSSVNFPSISGLDRIPVWTSDDILDLDFIPKSVLVLGGGTVATELAQFLQRIGTEVTLIQRSSHILSDFAPDLAEVVEKALSDEGVEVITGTNLLSLKQVGDEIEVLFEHEGKTVSRRAKHCLNALGRKPRTQLLRLDLAGVRTAPNGQIVTDSFQQTTNPDIYAAGDCSSPHEIVHIAIIQGETAARHAFNVETEPVHYDHLLQVIFTDPQIATVGFSEKQLKLSGRQYISASYPFDDHGKSILMEALRGFVRVFADKSTGEILGAEIVSRDAGELIHCFSVGIAMKATVFDLLRAPWYHPTLAEILTYPLEDIADEIEAAKKN